MTDCVNIIQKIFLDAIKKLHFYLKSTKINLTNRLTVIYRYIIILVNISGRRDLYENKHEY